MKNLNYKILITQNKPYCNIINQHLWHKYNLRMILPFFTCLWAARSVSHKELWGKRPANPTSLISFWSYIYLLMFSNNSMVAIKSMSKSKLLQKNFLPCLNESSLPGCQLEVGTWDNQFLHPYALYPSPLGINSSKDCYMYCTGLN